MKIQLMIATVDVDYAQHLSRVLTDRNGDSFEVSLCSSQEHFEEMLKRQHYDVVLMSPEMVSEKDLQNVGLPLVLWDETERTDPNAGHLDAVRKYQRISTLAGEVLGKYSAVAGKRRTPDMLRAKITVVWSPAGGAGKTTVALAYATRQVADGKAVTYLNLEHFSSVPVYFANNGKSISQAFEKLDSNLELLLQSIRKQDTGSGVFYFCAPSNYDDINILTNENLRELIAAAGQGMDEVVLDLSSVCDARTRFLFEEADTLLTVVDGSRRGVTKWEQFKTQHDIFARAKEKMVLVCNMGATIAADNLRCIKLPYVRSDSPVSVYKNLSASNFNV